jgi:hypothetical protein
MQQSAPTTSVSSHTRPVSSGKLGQLGRLADARALEPVQLIEGGLLQAGNRSCRRECDRWPEDVLAARPVFKRQRMSFRGCQRIVLEYRKPKASGMHLVTSRPLRGASDSPRPRNSKSESRSSAQGSALCQAAPRAASYIVPFVGMGSLHACAASTRSPTLVPAPWPLAARACLR